MIRSSLVFAALVFAGCAEDPFFLEAKSVAVCQHLPAQRFQVPGELREQYARLPPAMQQGLELQRTFDFDVSSELPSETAAMLESRFALTSISLSVVNREDHLGFIDEAHLQLQPGASSGLEERGFDYVRTEAEPRAIAWNGSAFDVAAYLESGNLKYTVSLVGSLPPGDVLVDIDACAEVKVKLDYL
ncbi:MAG: hypothetical protein Q8N23_09090 [Archangium sp.]|nr:hypothetical protein [Archangium sp.]MDP3152813.1 hypothetical protein [Archangium sp.]MDP3571729.1 hypothetical protein [Archangium sp.]